MSWSWGWTYLKDRALLRDCHRGERSAIEKFNNLSYMNTIRMTVRSVTEGIIDDCDEIESVAVLCAAEIYRRSDEVVSYKRDLRSSVRRAAHNFATDYVRQKYR